MNNLIANLSKHLEEGYSVNLLKSVVKENILRPLSEDKNTLVYKKY